MKPTGREITMYVGLGVLGFGGYVVIAYAAKAPVEVVMPAWVPFLPWLAVPYLLQVIVSFALVLAVRDRARRHASMKAYFAAFAATCLIWLWLPTVMHRPPMPAGWWNWPFRVMVSLDLPVNILPAGHILLPVITCWAFALDRPRWLWWLVPCQVLGAVAIVTTWQHRPVDVAIGVTLAVAAGAFFGVGRRRAPERLPAQS